MYLLAPFMLQNFYKKILNQSYEDVRHFWDQNSQFLLNKIFGATLCYYFHLPIGRKVFHLPETKFLFGKLLLSFSATYYPISLCKILKKFFQRIQSYEHVQFMGPKMTLFPK